MWGTRHVTGWITANSVLVSVNNRPEILSLLSIVLLRFCEYTIGYVFCNIRTLLYGDLRKPMKTLNILSQAREQVHLLCLYSRGVTKNFSLPMLGIINLPSSLTIKMIYIAQEVHGCLARETVIWVLYELKLFHVQMDKKPHIMTKVIAFLFWD